MSETKEIGGELGTLPSYLRVALQRYASDESQHASLTPATYLQPVRLRLECREVPHEEVSHPFDDATGHIDREPYEFTVDGVLGQR